MRGAVASRCKSLIGLHIVTHHFYVVQHHAALRLAGELASKAFLHNEVHCDESVERQDHLESHDD